MQSLRTSELFASKDWLVLYRAFTTVNFNATDPTSINQSLRDYIAANYPEDFNDWIESSEFVAIIDLLAWLAGTLAFKTDINARENFLDTAEARESILRLARFLSYNPRRNRPATGMVKLVEVQTDDDIYDSTGASLSGVKVQWNNNDDPDWFERFTAIMSNAFVGTNPFGVPLKAGTVANTRTHLYRLDCLMGSNNFAFNGVVGGESMDFELCNGDFDDLGTFYERTPDNNAAFNLFYRNDGNGNGAARTGFFMLFKQGSTVKQNYRIDNPVENQILDLDVAGVNETDVWVQTIADDGQVLLNWTKVPAIFSENITYNTIDSTNRDIFSVLTRDQDRVSIRFADGIFGSAPVGNIRVWHRVSNGRQYQIRPNDINRITQTVRYYNKAGVLRNLRMTFSLQESVANATPRETNEQIRQRAPSTYAAQNRMVSGEDYNTFPLSSNLAVKVKALNRVYSGHSRFIDLNDPTSTYTDVVVTADDGLLYSETANVYEEVPILSNNGKDELAVGYLQPFIRHLNIRTYVNHEIMSRLKSNSPNPEINFSANTRWTQSTTAKFSSSGYFNLSNLYFRVGNSIKFRLPNGIEKWVGIASLNGQPTNQQPDQGVRGPVTLAEDIPTGSKVIAILPGFNTELPVGTINELSQRFSATGDRRNFSLWFDAEQSRWMIRNDTVALSRDSDRSDAIHVANIEFNAGGLWKFSARGIRYVMESARKIKWFYDGATTLDAETGIRRRDSVSILRSNSNLNDPTGAGIGSDQIFNLANLYYNSDGSQEPRRVQVEFTDLDGDGAPDDPESFVRLTQGDKPQTTLFWRSGQEFGHTAFIPCRDVNVFTHIVAGVSDIPTNIRTHKTDPANIVFRSGDITYVESLDQFYEWRGEWKLLPRRDFSIAQGRGPNTAKRWMVLALDQSDANQDGVPDDGKGKFFDMYSKNANEVAVQQLNPDRYVIRNGEVMFKWKHYAAVDHRIDPSITNVVDIFMLTTEYDFAVRQWIASGANPAEMPVAPTELDLRLIMQDYQSYKMFSDEIVWRPISYKYLFGTGSEKFNLRARFKVVKLPNTTFADGEIKSRIVQTINEFFDSTRWDFGETFYYTELAAYVHQQLAGMIGSIVIVPMDEEASFGDGFEIKCRSDEIFISTAQVNDIEIINSNTASNLRIR